MQCSFKHTHSHTHISTLHTEFECLFFWSSLASRAFHRAKIIPIIIHKLPLGCSLLFIMSVYIYISYIPTCCFPVGYWVDISVSDSIRATCCIDIVRSQKPPSKPISSGLREEEEKKITTTRNIVLKQTMNM